MGYSDDLFVPQRDQGIDAHGAARGEVSGNQTNRDHYGSGNDNRKRAGDWQAGDQAGGYAVPQNAWGAPIARPAKTIRRAS
jgi:hypothetical protein